MTAELTALASTLKGSPMIVRLLHGKVDAAMASAAINATPTVANIFIEY